MTIHVRYLSQVIVKISFKGKYTDKMVKEFDRCLDEQHANAKKPLFYMIDVTNYDVKESEEIANQIADKLAERGKIVQNMAFLFTKKRKIKNKEIKDRVKVFDNEFQAQSYLSDASRFGFLDEITLESLVED